MAGLFSSSPDLAEVLKSFAPKLPSFGAFAGSIGAPASQAPSSTFGLFSKPDVGSVTQGGAFKITGFGPQGNPIYEPTASSGALTGLQPSPNAGKYKPTRVSNSKVTYGGMGGGSGGGGASPIEFNLGAPPEMSPLELPYEEFALRLGQINQPEQLAGLAARYNAPTQQAFESYLPQFRPSLAALGNIAYDYLGARIPRSVAQEIGRSSAAANLRTGLFGGGMGRGLVARDLGLQGLDLQRTGADLLGRSVGLTQQAMQLASPVSVSNLMISPQMAFETMMNQAQYNQQIANQNLFNAWQSQPLPGQYVLGRGFQTFTPGQYSATRPLRPDVQLNWGSDVRGVDLQGRPLAGRPVGGLAGSALRNMAANWVPTISSGSASVARV